METWRTLGQALDSSDLVRGIKEAARSNICALPPVALRHGGRTVGESRSEFGISEIATARSEQRPSSAVVISLVLWKQCHQRNASARSQRNTMSHS